MIFLDCEFNGHNGRLISMALVSNLTDKEFYEVLHIPNTEEINPWVLATVVPILGKPAIHEELFRDELHKFLNEHKLEPIMADSPADFRYLLDYMHWMDGDKYRYLGIEQIMMLVVPDRKKYWPENPLEHNALSDAKTLMKWNDWNINDNMRNGPQTK